MSNHAHRLILFSGPPGVGKSTLGYRLAQQTGWAILAKDQCDRVLKSCLTAPYPSAMAYELMFGLAELNLRNGVSVILDAVFGMHGFRQRAIDLAAQCDAQFHAVVCYCSDRELWRQRTEIRPEMVPGWTPADWTEAQRVEGYYEPWSSPHLLLDAADSLDDSINLLLRSLQLANG